MVHINVCTCEIRTLSEPKPSVAPTVATTPSNGDFQVCSTAVNATGRLRTIDGAVVGVTSTQKSIATSDPPVSPAPAANPEPCVPMCQPCKTAGPWRIDASQQQTTLPPDLNATDSGVSASCVPGGFGQVAVTFSSTLFRWSWKRPDFYRIVVMEGQSDLSRTCRELPLDRTMIKGVVTTLERPFLATDARWNPFKGTNSTEVTFIIGGSDNACNSTDSSTYAALFCNRALTPGKVYTVFVQAVIAVPHMIVTAPLVAVTVRFDGLTDEVQLVKLTQPSDRAANAPA
ncbi:uncharacterized protein LOC117643333 [Thrips palmi]|uniref:Uncharacterized protein LOC117643333 n=1 Tax=Thrips palmi TaxID=161013 RepID=A0A6P8YLS6_THRPL|nr:uncharacterized protein LOC117643333 [Thrips palmi]